MSSNNYFIAVNLKDSASPNTTYYFKGCNRKLFYKEQDTIPLKLVYENWTNFDYGAVRLKYISSSASIVSHVK